MALWQALHSKKMECLQERAWRAVYRTKSAPYQTLLQISGLPRRLDTSDFDFKILIFLMFEKNFTMTYVFLD